MKLKEKVGYRLLVAATFLALPFVANANECINGSGAKLEQSQLPPGFAADYALVEMNFCSGALKAVGATAYAISWGSTELSIKMIRPGVYAVTASLQELNKLKIGKEMKARIGSTLKAMAIMDKAEMLTLELVRTAGLVVIAVGVDGTYEMITKSDKTPIQDFLNYISYMPTNTSADDTMSYYYLQHFDEYLKLDSGRAQFYANDDARLKGAVKIFADLIRNQK